MKIRLPVESGNTQKALQDFLKKLLVESVVDAVLVPMRTPDGVIAPALVSTPQLLEHADPLAPVMAVNNATLVGKLSIRKPRPRVAAVLRSCEMRALIELTKMQQASLDDLLLISVDCAGTYSVVNYREKTAGNGDKPENLWSDLFNAASQTPGVVQTGLRNACQMCEQPVFDKAQVIIELFGSDLTQEINLSVPDEIAGKLHLEETKPGMRDGIVEKLVAARTTQREQEFTAIRTRLDSEDITGVFAACIRCHNCMTACPICYCKTCVFKTHIYDHDPMQYMMWSQQKGAYRMPADSMLFHLTRLNHMVLSCVGCGMCTEACPSDLPVGSVFRAIGQRVQATFDYLPGRNLEEQLPLITFKADEWTEVGE